MDSTVRTMLVVGDNHEELVKKYDKNTKLESHIKYKFSDASKIRNDNINLIKQLIDSPKISDRKKNCYREMLSDMMDMDDLEFFYYITSWSNCTYDPDTNDAYTTENDNAMYYGARCYDKYLKATGDEGPFSNPFHLKDGSLSYIAHYNEINWDRMHKYNIDLYKGAWEICMNEREPKTEEERMIFNSMSNRKGYFQSFGDKENYVLFSCSFWTYAYLDENGFKYIDNKTSDIEWVKSYYDNFIKKLEQDNPLLSIYEIRLID